MKQDKINKQIDDLEKECLHLAEKLKKIDGATKASFEIQTVLREVHEDSDISLRQKRVEIVLLNSKKERINVKKNEDIGLL